MENFPTEIRFCSFDSLTQKIDDFENLHKNLINLCLMIVDVFGVLMLMLLMAHFCYILYESHGIYQCVRKVNFQVQDYWITINYFLWFTLVSLELFFIAISSGSVIKEV